MADTPGRGSLGASARIRRHLLCIPVESWPTTVALGSEGQSGRWLSSEDLIADGLADRGRPRRVANLRTCSASPSGPRRLCSFGHRAVDCVQCSATTCLLVRGAGDVLRCGRWCSNGCIRPVLKHGPRSATCVRVFG